jgi:hypothetical protein
VFLFQATTSTELDQLLEVELVDLHDDENRGERVLVFVFSGKKHVDKARWKALDLLGFSHFFESPQNQDFSGNFDQAILEIGEVGDPLDSHRFFRHQVLCFNNLAKTALAYGVDNFVAIVRCCNPILVEFQLSHLLEAFFSSDFKIETEIHLWHFALNWTFLGWEAALMVEWVRHSTWGRYNFFHPLCLF